MLQLSQDGYAFVYLIATIFFIFGLKGLASPKTALRGNNFAMLGMGLAIVATLVNPAVTSYTWIIAGIVGGAIIGTTVALRIQMTSMPELVAALHSFVGLSAVLVAIGTYMMEVDGLSHKVFDAVFGTEISLGAAIGAITFTGSIIAFGKLKGSLSSSPVIFPGQHILNLVLLLVTIGLCAKFSIDPDMSALITLTVIAFVFGVLIVIPIGSADMPVVVSMLNSYSGWAASATGFTLGNNLLIATGALVGSSGAILSYIMCKAMNRSFISVILGGFGGKAEEASGDKERKPVKSAAAEDAAFLMENASKVIVVPGYGMAVAQAQHALRELYDILLARDIEMKFAIHPVAGRMPGHMNVLLAEADIPYECVEELEEVNGDFSTADVVLVVGANDIVNPAAKTDKSSPLFGMPILDAYRSRQVYILKRSMGSGYSGVDNDLFYYDNASLIFGDAKETCSKIVNALNES